MIETTLRQAAAPVPRLGYIPSIDGWRAIAILAVMLHHDFLPSFSSLPPFQSRGAIGVNLFFAISGFLICTLILEREQNRGPFHLKPFYIRRLFRIQPAALTYLAVVALLMLFGIVHESWRFWSGAVFLYQNFLWSSADAQSVLNQSLFTGHFWTLAVEEHFYIVLSSVLFFIPRFRAVVVTVLLFGLIAFTSVLVHFLHVDPFIHSRATCWFLPFLIFPSLLAVLLRNPATLEGVRRWLHPGTAFVLTAAAILLLARFHWHTRPFSFDTFDRSLKLLAFSFAVWVVATTFHPRSWTSRILSLPPLRFIGRISYSLYLWHVLFFLPARPQAGVGWPPLVFLAHIPWRYLATFAAAYASYRLIELPGTRLGHRLANRAETLAAGHLQQAPSVADSALVG